MTRAPFLPLALALFLAGASCTSRQPEERGATAEAPPQEANLPLTVALAGEPDQLVPPLARSPASAAIWPWILPSLVRIDAGSASGVRVLGDLAASWEIDEKGLVARFRLATNRFWEDTTVVSVEDVVESYRLYKDPAIAGKWPARLGEVLEVDQDPAQAGVVRFRFRVPLYRDRIFQLAALPVISSEQWRLTRDRRAPLGSPALPVLAAGPFRIVEWRPGELLRLERHPFPPRDRVAGVDRLDLRFVPVGESRAMQVEHATADVACDLPIEAMKRLRDAGAEVQIRPAGAMGIEALAWNLDDPRWGRFGLRRYLHGRIDRPRICRAVSGSVEGEALGEPCAGFLTAWGDSATAAAFSDTVHMRTDQIMPSLELLYDCADPLRERIAVELALQLDRLGVSCRLDPHPADVCAERLAARRFQAAIVGWSIPALSDLGEVYGSGGTHNVAGLKDPEVDRLIAQARGAGADTIPGAWRLVEDRAAERMPYLFLLHRPRFDATGPRVADYRADPSQPYGDLLSLRRR